MYIDARVYAVGAFESRNSDTAIAASARRRGAVFSTRMVQFGFQIYSEVYVIFIGIIIIYEELIERYC